MPRAGGCPGPCVSKRGVHRQVWGGARLSLFLAGWREACSSWITHVATGAGKKFRRKEEAEMEEFSPKEMTCVSERSISKDFRSGCRQQHTSTNTEDWSVGWQRGRSIGNDQWSPNHAWRSLQLVLCTLPGYTCALLLPAKTLCRKLTLAPQNWVPHLRRVRRGVNYFSSQAKVVWTNPDVNLPSRVPRKFKWGFPSAELGLRSHLACFILSQIGSTQ